MKSLDTYIVEKFKISKNIKPDSAIYKKYFPTEKEYKKVKELFTDYKHGYSKFTCWNLANSTLRNYISKIKYWLALLDFTNSSPYQVEDYTIHSYPARYGDELVVSILDQEDTMTAETLLEIYDSFINSSYVKNEPLPKFLEKEYEQKITSLLEYVFSKDMKYTFTLKCDARKENKFSSKAEQALDKKQVTVIPFDVKYKTKEAHCEICYEGSTYYYYIANGEFFKTYTKFCPYLKEILEVED